MKTLAPAYSKAMSYSFSTSTKHVTRVRSTAPTSSTSSSSTCSTAHRARKLLSEGAHLRVLHQGAELRHVGHAWERRGRERCQLGDASGVGQAGGADSPPPEPIDSAMRRSMGFCMSWSRPPFDIIC